MVDQEMVDQRAVVLLQGAHRIHVPEIVHHVPEIEQNNALVAAVAMIALVQHVTFQMVVR